MFIWTPDMLRFMADASEHTDYYAQLAAQLAPFLPRQGHVCDAGCGLGYLSEQLASLCRRVTAVDISPLAFACFQDRLARTPMDNITPLCGDLGALAPRKSYDAMVFCFFGGLHEILKYGRAQCCGKLLIIKKDYDLHRFSLTRQPLQHFRFCDSLTALEELNIPYEAFRTELSLGQPLRSLDDAVLFFQTYSRDERKEDITASSVLPRLQETNSSQFPYYLPQRKKMGIVVIDTADIPKTLPWEEEI